MSKGDFARFPNKSVESQNPLEVRQIRVRRKSTGGQIQPVGEFGRRQTDAVGTSPKPIDTGPHGDVYYV